MLSLSVLTMNSKKTRKGKMFFKVCVVLSLAAGTKFGDALGQLDLDDLKGGFDLTNFVDMLDTG